MKVFCPALLSGKYFATKHADRGIQGGQNISPRVSWSDVPPGTRSFALSMVDRHPVANNWVHWFVLNIPASTREIPERASGIYDHMPPGSMELRNSYGEIGYGGPKPPRGSGPHEYVITVYALNVDSLLLGPFSKLDECLRAFEGKVLDSGSVIGIFQQ